MAPRTPLLRPDRYFAERELRFGRIFAALGLVVGASLATVYGVGYLMVMHIDGTVLVDNPERPPEMVCNDDTNSTIYNESNCAAPPQIERNVDPIIWDAVGQLVGPMLGGILILIGVLTLLLHAGTWLAGGTNGAAESFAVTVWGMAPMVVAVPVGLAALSVVLDPVTVATAQEPATAFESMETQLRANQWIGTVVGAVSSLWSAVIWRFGLEHKRGVSGAAATVLAGSVALVVLLAGAL